MGRLYSWQIRKTLIQNMGRPKKQVNKGGRPTVMTQEVVAKLEQAFAIDCSVEEACSYADISRNTFYDYIKINPSFSDRIEQLRQKPVLKARTTVVAKLGDSFDNSMEYLRRKKKTEFGDSLSVESTIHKPYTITEEQKKVLDELP